MAVFNAGVIPDHASADFEADDLDATDKLLATIQKSVPFGTHLSAGSDALLDMVQGRGGFKENYEQNYKQLRGKQNQFAAESPILAPVSEFAGRTATAALAGPAILPQALLGAAEGLSEGEGLDSGDYTRAGVEAATGGTLGALGGGLGKLLSRFRRARVPKAAPDANPITPAELADDVSGAGRAGLRPEADLAESLRMQGPQAPPFEAELAEPSMLDIINDMAAMEGKVHNAPVPPPNELVHQATKKAWPPTMQRPPAPDKYAAPIQTPDAPPYPQANPNPVVTGAPEVSGPAVGAQAPDVIKGLADAVLVGTGFSQVPGLSPTQRILLRMAARALSKSPGTMDAIAGGIAHHILPRVAPPLTVGSEMLGDAMVDQYYPDDDEDIGYLLQQAGKLP